VVDFVEAKKCYVKDGNRGPEIGGNRGRTTFNCEHFKQAREFTEPK